jgi:hypothetical protein
MAATVAPLNVHKIQFTTTMNQIDPLPSPYTGQQMATNNLSFVVDALNPPEQMVRGAVPVIDGPAAHGSCSGV